MSTRRQHGFTLMEMIVAMVIISVALAGVLGVLSRTSVDSADPMVTKQMTAIAEGLMEEIQLKPFTAGNTAVTAGCARASYDEIGDYNGYAFDVCDVSGVAGPAGYSVTVTVDAAVGDITNNIPADDIRRISIVVSNGSDNYTLVGWRTNYAEEQL